MLVGHVCVFFLSRYILEKVILDVMLGLDELILSVDFLNPKIRLFHVFGPT